MILLQNSVFRQGSDKWEFCITSLNPRNLNHRKLQSLSRSSFEETSSLMLGQIDDGVTDIVNLTGSRAIKRQSLGVSVRGLMFLDEIN